MENVEMKNLQTQARNSEASIVNKLEEVEERITGIKDVKTLWKCQTYNNKIEKEKDTQDNCPEFVFN